VNDQQSNKTRRLTQQVLVVSFSIGSVRASRPRTRRALCWRGSALQQGCGSTRLATCLATCLTMRRLSRPPMSRPPSGSAWRGS
jgi:hypothetical protein